MLKLTTTRLATAFIAASLFALPAMAAEQKADQPQATAVQLDKDSFVKAVLSAGKFEIDSSKLVMEKSTAKDITAFADMMIADYTKASEDLWNLLSKQGSSEEPPPVALSTSHEAALKLLIEKTGAEFETAYIDLQTKAHSDAVSLFRAYADKPDDKALGAFAATLLPLLEKHLQDIEKIAAAR